MGDKHTPTLLKLKPLVDQIGIHADGYGFIAFVPTTGPNPDRNKRQKVYAALIVRAVNRDHLFGELVEALERALPMVGAPHDYTIGDVWQAQEQARAVLAKVEDEGHG